MGIGTYIHWIARANPVLKIGWPLLSKNFSVKILTSFWQTLLNEAKHEESQAPSSNSYSLLHTSMFEFFKLFRLLYSSNF